jgi:putative ABC transport system permease protein
VVVGSVLAQRAGLTLGDPLTIQTGNRSADVRVAGIANEYLVGGLALYMERDAARRRLGIDGADAFALLAKPNQRERLAAALAAYCQQRGLLLQSYADLSQIVEGMTNGIVGGLWVLLALGIVVSSCGMVNTLSMNVVEQSRELALMRATGMTRPQLGRMILAQAAAIGLVGATPGVVVGMVMALLINWASLPVLGRAIDFEVHPWYVVACLATALIVSMASAWLPTRRAARLTVAAALRCE